MTSSEVWRTFEENEVTHSVAHHLTAIGELLDRNGYARGSDVARQLGITRGSASPTLKTLKERDLVREDENKFLRLSPRAQRVVDTVKVKRAIVRKFLQDVLQVDAEQSEIDACKVEHLLSRQTSDKLLHLVRFLLGDSTVATSCLEAFWQETDLCHDLANCALCDLECLMNLNQASRKPTAP